MQEDYVLSDWMIHQLELVYQKWTTTSNYSKMRIQILNEDWQDTQDWINNL